MVFRPVSTCIVRDEVTLTAWAQRGLVWGVRICLTLAHFQREWVMTWMQFNESSLFPFVLNAVAVALFIIFYIPIIVKTAKARAPWHMSPENPGRSSMTGLAHAPPRAAWAGSRNACPSWCQVTSTPDALRGGPSRTELGWGIQGLIVSAKPRCASMIFHMQNSIACRSLIAEA